MSGRAGSTCRSGTHPPHARSRLHLLRRHHHADEPARFRLVFAPPNSRPIQSGTLVPPIFEIRAAWAKVTGMIPGTIGAVIPAARHRSRNRRAGGGGRYTTCVIALVAPASSFLRLRSPGPPLAAGLDTG